MRGAIRVLAFLLVSALVVSGAPAHASSPALTGTVTDAANVPQVGVAVEVLSGASVVATASTDETGGFEAAVPAGVYDVRFTPPADRGLQAYLASGVSTDSPPLTVVLRPVQVVHVEGTVRDQNGAALAISGLELQPVTPGLPSVQARRDDRVGHYAADLLTGLYRVSTGVAAVEAWVTLKADVLISRDLTHDPIVSVSTLTIVARDTDGVPVMGAAISINRGADTATFTSSAENSVVETDAAGLARVRVLTGMPEYRTTLSAQNGAHVSFTVPEMVGDRTVAVTVPPPPPPPRLVHMAGAVRRDSGVPLAVAVTLEPVEPGLPTVSTRTASGGYAVDVQPGTYRIRLGLEEVSGWVWFKDSVEITTDTTKDLVVRFCKLTVVVRDASGTPVPAAVFGVYPGVDAPDYTAGSEEARSGTTDASGSASVELFTGARAQPVTLQLANGLRFPFTVPALAGDTRVEVTVPAAVHVDGVVRASAGHTLALGSLQLHPVSPGLTMVDAQVTLATGRYTALLLAGTYQLSASVGLGGDHGGYVEFSDDVAIPTDTTHDLTIDAATLRVAIQDSSGAPLAGASFSLSGSVQTPRYRVSSESTPVVVGTDGTTALPVFAGIPAHPTILQLPDGVRIPFTVPAISGDRRLVIIVNRTTGSVIVDDQPPSVIGLPDRPAVSGWYRAPVTVSWQSTDPSPSSGPPSTPPPITVSGEGRDQRITSAPSCDAAGNCATGEYVVSLDLTKPAITPTVAGTRSPSGWYTSPVRTSFTCADALSGIATCPAPVDLVDGADQEVSRTAADRAGNTATARVLDVDVDATLPSVTIRGVTAGAEYPLDAVPAPSCVTDDVTSGVGTQATLTVTRDATGLHTAACVGALDRAGNSTPRTSVSYRVRPTVGGLSSLTTTYVLGSGSSHAQGANSSLLAHLNNGNYCGYINRVQQETNGPQPTLTPAQAEELIYWARILDPTC